MKGGRRMIVVVANTRIKDGYQSEILQLAKVVSDATRQESGCISYRFLQDPYDICEFFFIEEWQDAQSLQAHRSTAHVLEWRDKIAHMVAERKIKRYSANEVDV